MKYLIALSLLFCFQLPVMAEDTISKILIKEGDVIEYPTDTEPIEVMARMGNFLFNCAIMPGDSLRIEEIYDESNGESSIKMEKIGGTKGNQEVCPTKIYVFVIGMKELIKTKDGLPERWHSVSIPFVLGQIALKKIQVRKNQPKISATEAITFRKGDEFQYPLDAEPVEMEARVNGLDFSCVIAPGDIFKITAIDNYSRWGIRGHITFKKEEGTQGDQDICPMGTLLERIRMPKCELVKTEQGVPEGINCEVSLPNFFN